MHAHPNPLTLLGREIRTLDEAVEAILGSREKYPAHLTQRQVAAIDAVAVATTGSTQNTGIYAHLRWTLRRNKNGATFTVERV